MIWRLRRLRKLVVLAALFAPSAAFAERTTVELSIDSCEDPTAILHMVQVELGDALVTAGGGVRASITCDGPIAILRVEAMVEGHAMRGVDLRTAVPEARARLIALALAEMVDARPTPAPTPSPAPVITPPSAGVPFVVASSIPATAPSRARVSFGARAMRFMGNRNAEVVPGAGARLSIDASAHRAWMFDAHVGLGNQWARDAEIAVGLVGLGAAAQAVAHAGTTRLDVAVGVRAGLARLSGDTMTWNKSGGSVLGTWFGPMARAGVSLPLTQNLALEASTEGGYVVTPVIGMTEYGAPVASIEGYWLQLELGLTFRL